MTRPGSTFLVALGASPDTIPRIDARFEAYRVRGLADVPTYLLDGSDSLADFSRLCVEVAGTTEPKIAIEPVGGGRDRNVHLFRARRLGHAVRASSPGQQLLLENPQSPTEAIPRFPHHDKTRFPGWDAEVELSAKVPARPSPDRNGRIPSDLSLSSFPIIGRDAELSRLVEFLLYSGSWLTTITGPAGVGKTRLATSVMHEQLADGAQAFFVDLSHAGREEDVIEAVAGVVGTAPEGERPESCLASLGPSVLVLDDPLVPDVVTDLLHHWRRAFSHLRFVVTSPMPLQVAGERSIPLAPLGLMSGGPREWSESEVLFRQVARHAAGVSEPALPDRGMIHRLCSVMEGLPLPIVIVASQVGTQPLGSILEALEQGRTHGALANSGVVEICLAEAPSELRPALRALAYCHGTITHQCALHILAALGSELGFDANATLEELLKRGLVAIEIHSGRLRVPVVFRPGNRDFVDLPRSALTHFLSGLCAELVQHFPRSPARTVKQLREERSLLLQTLESLAESHSTAKEFEPIGRALLHLAQYSPMALAQRLEQAAAKHPLGSDLDLLLSGLSVEALQLESQHSRSASVAASCIKKCDTSTNEEVSALVRLYSLKALGNDASRRGDTEVALRRLQEAAALAVDTVPTEYLEIQGFAAVAQRRAGRLDDAEDTIRSALDFADSTGILAVRPKLLTTLVTVEFDRGEFDAAASAAEDAAALANEVGDDRAACAASVNGAIALHEAGRARESLEVMERVLPSLDRYPPIYQGKTWLHYGATLISFARFREALEAFQHASRSSRLLGDRTFSAEISIEVARCHFAAGDLRPAEVEIRRAERALGSDRVDLAGWNLLDSMIRIDVLQGRFPDARARSARGRAAAVELGNLARASEFSSLEALALALDHDAADAAKALDIADELFRSSGLVEEKSTFLLARGWTAIVNNQGLEQAADDLEQLIERFESHGDGTSTEFLLTALALAQLHGKLENGSSAEYFIEVIDSLLAARGKRKVPAWIATWVPQMGVTSTESSTLGPERSRPAPPEPALSLTQTTDIPLTPLAWLAHEFEVVGSLGAGQFGTVYRARDRELQRDVAIKCFHAANGMEPSSFQIEEGRLLARVDHPNVVRIHSLRRNGPTVVLIMEYLDGRTLEDRLQAGTRFDLRSVQGLALGLCRAVSALHEVGLIHRDIKPQNVMLAAGPDGLERAVLMDLGLGMDVSNSRPGRPEAAGSPVYMAPELFAGHPPTRASDIYSLGVVLFRVLTGELPVEAMTLAELMGRHERHERKSLADLRPDLPLDVYEAVEWSLAADPRNRVSSLNELEGLISQWSSEVPALS